MKKGQKLMSGRLDGLKTKPAKTKQPTEAVISDRTWLGSQSWNRECIVTIVGGVRLRYSMKSDAYDFQSYAKVERWTGEKWEVIHRIAGQAMQTKASYVDRNVKSFHFDADMKELRHVAHAIVGAA